MKIAYRKPVVLRVATIAALNFATVRRLRSSANARAPDAPTAPASVGVNNPPTRPPSTSTIRSTTSPTTFSDEKRSVQEYLRPGGPSDGRQLHRRKIVAM